jgi:hypothetical protein
MEQLWFRSRITDAEPFGDEDGANAADEAFEPDAYSTRIAEALEKFLGGYANVRTRDIYRHRLESLFACQGISYVGEITAPIFESAIGGRDPKPDSPSVTLQTAAAMRSFCSFAATQYYAEMDPLLDEAIGVDADLAHYKSADERGNATASNITQGLAYRHTFAASLAAVGLGPHLDRLRLTDLLVDRSHRCWLVLDSPVRRRRPARQRWVQGGLLVEMTPELRNLGARSHRLLANGAVVPELFLTARGSAAKRSVLITALRKRSASELLTFGIARIPATFIPRSRRRLFNGIIRTTASARGMSYRGLAQATGVDSRYWWRVLEGHVATVPPPGLLARLAVVLSMRVRTVLYHAGYDADSVLRATRIYP